MPATTLARPSRLPPYVRGPKPRRRTELGLLIFGAIITSACYILASLGAKSKIPPHIGPFLGIIFGLAIIAHIANRWLAPEGNPVILPIAMLLNGIGYVIIVRWNPPAPHDHKAVLQAAWTALGIACYVATLAFLKRTRDLDRYRYSLLLIAGCLLLAPLLPGIGRNINGARLWVSIGGAEFQPVEIAKLLLVIFFASYFVEKKELLSIPTARVGNRLVIDPRPLVPILLAWGMAIVVIGLENDIGFAFLIFTLFVLMLWITTGRIGYVIFGIVLFVAGAFFAAHAFHQVHERVDIWLNPWNSKQQGAGQLTGGWYSLGSGGVGGTGLGQGVSGLYVSNITSDLIFAGIGEEMGFMGTSAVVIAFLLLVGAGLNIAQRARSDFSRLLATGLTIALGFQAFFIMAGVLRLLPLTGITLPFVAYGGSSLVANYILLALLMRISDEGTKREEEPQLVPVGA